MMATVADAEGMVWLLGEGVAHRRPHPDGQRSVKVTATHSYRPFVVALTECGELWEVGRYHWRSIHDTRADLPRGLVPYPSTDNGVLLLPDHCCGKARLCLFARIAGRLQLPSDLVCQVMVPLMIHDVYITGAANDPFGNPVPH
eukprot:TRINITY_DN32990_c0_g1_i1.p1 TRINITY_DN32990_c0_g1~~TRINITY_DN32990_c0_g1_i1.p1  ORF type:complete len:144 (+),score=12.51 TRINITY_DN32990_c0_g1_i1:215-646(+)